jgi:hypothetical protein
MSSVSTLKVSEISGEFALQHFIFTQITSVAALTASKEFAS